MDSIGGFRLVRRLGSGPRADVHLGHSMVDRGAEPRTAAIKVFRESTPLESVDGEIEALARLSSRFLLRLDDLAMSAGDVPVLILQRVGPVALSALCLDRDRIAPGEAVTMIAPIAEAVEQMHRVGVAHGNLRLGSVHFDESGAPVLLGFGAATIIGPLPNTPGAHSLTPAALESSLAALKDLDDLRSMARTIIECTDASVARSSFTGWLAGDIHDPVRFCAELRDRLFDFATPVPVELTSRPVKGTAIPRPPVEERHSPAEPSRVPQWLAAMHLPGWLEEFVTSVRREPLARLRAFLAPVRTPVWITAAVIAMLLVVAVAVVGTDGSAPADAAVEPRPSATPSVAGGVAADDAAATDPTAGRAPAGSADERARLVRGEDPVAAVGALVIDRAECFRQHSVLCLDAVDQPASAAMEADVYAISTTDESARVIISDRAPDLTRATPVLVEHLGGSALVALEFEGGDTADIPVEASVLVVKGESGWRIRDLVVG